MRLKINLLFFLSIVILPSSVLALSEATKQEIYSSYLRGVIHLRKGEMENALAEFQTVQKLDPRNPYIHLKIAYTLIKIGRLDEAEQELKEAKQLNPDNLEASLGLIFLYSYTGRNKDLEKEYGEFLEKAHKLKPEDIRISEYLAQFYFYQKKIDDAIKIYETIVKVHPDYADAHYLLGYLYEEKGEYQKAIAEWKQVLKINPLHTDALNSLGYVYAEQGTNLEEAEQLIKKALEKQPDNGAYLDSLGWVYYKMGKYKKAEKYLKQASEKTEDPVILEHLGDLYVKMNKIQTALEYYRKAEKLNPESISLKDKISHYEEEGKTTQKKSKPDKKTDN